MDMKEWLTLDKAIEQEEKLMEEACDSKECDIAKFMRDCFVELKQRRESDLRPATKFLNTTILEQWENVVSEFGEATEELIKLIDKKDEKALPFAVEELVDLQMSVETMLAKLGLNEQQRMEARRKVIEKNKTRHYYKDGVTDED